MGRPDELHCPACKSHSMRLARRGTLGEPETWLYRCVQCDHIFNPLESHEDWDHEKNEPISDS